MKAVQVVARGQVEFVEAPKPVVTPGHALIRCHRLSLCGSDIFLIDHSDESRYPFAAGTTGHEMVGYVEEVMEPSNGVKVGDLALVMVPAHEAMAEYYVAPVEFVLVFPDKTPIEEMLQAQQLGTVIYAAKKLPNIIGKRVAVIGQGSAGLWWNYMTRRMGAIQVIGIDLQAHRLQLSGRYGATDTIHNTGGDIPAAVMALTGGHLADVVVVAAGESDTVNLGISLVADHGFILQFGVPHDRFVNVDFGDLFRRCATLQPIVYATREPGLVSTYLAMDLIANGEVDVKPIITHRFKFDQVLDAYELQRTRDEGAVKIVIEMD